MVKFFEEIPLESFEFWSGAKDNAKKLFNSEFDLVDDILSEDENLTASNINDLFWFDFETVWCEWLGHKIFNNGDDYVRSDDVIDPESDDLDVFEFDQLVKERCHLSPADLKNWEKIKNCLSLSSLVLTWCEWVERITEDLEDLLNDAENSEDADKAHLIECLQDTAEAIEDQTWEGLYFNENIV